MSKPRKFHAQVSKDYCGMGYDDLSRFISYFSQVDTVIGLDCRKILELGIGNGTVSNYLKRMKLDLTTFDINEELEPDYVGDIRDLPFEDGSFDLVMSCEVLEHLPWEDVDKAFSELGRVSKKYVFISLPYSCISFEFVIKFPYAKKLLGKTFLKLLLRIPYFYKQHSFDGEHYWVIGRKGYSLKVVRDRIKKHFKVMKEFSPVLDSGHYFFILEKLG